jgi:N-acetyl-anhydromuramyl-L-alanine amidase AmpD
VEQKEAQAWVDELKTFSRRFFEHSGLPAEGSPHGHPRFVGPPNGIILHHTADPSLLGVLKWFCSPLSNTSAHVVVGQVQEACHPILSRDLPRVAGLPVTVVLARPVESVAFHATWANAWAYGIELCNIGELRQAPGGTGFVDWRNNWTHVHDSLLRPLVANQRYFANYLDGQLRTSALIGAILAGISPIVTDRVVGHENVQGEKTIGAGGFDKRDVGPAFCLDWYRESMLSNFWPQAQLSKDSQDITNGWPRRGELLGMNGEMAFSGQYAVVPMFAKGMLKELNYWISKVNDSWDAREKRSLRLFQRMSGIKDDGIYGTDTARQLILRYRDRFLKSQVVA